MLSFISCPILPIHPELPSTHIVLPSLSPISPLFPLTPLSPLSPPPPRCLTRAHIHTEPDNTKSQQIPQNSENVCESNTQTNP